ncbi:MAG: Transcriptional regulator, AbiEi antitoxin, Type system [Friedmanniella sp.]|nr:Transcriptional regulator, AbiEi antitoxin, Type system [Friedmanniella sp.]
MVGTWVGYGGSTGAAAYDPVPGHPARRPQMSPNRLSSPRRRVRVSRVSIQFLDAAQSNRGVFSRAEALDCGESDASLARARRAGQVVRLRRGMYVSAAAYEACDDAGKHLLHARAALAAQQGPVALTGASAAALHGFAIYQQDLSVVHLLRLDGGSPRRAAAANHHCSTQPAPADDVGLWDGVASVSPARAVWEVACRSGLESAVVTADSALRIDPGLGDQLRAWQEHFAHAPGSRTARLALRLADPGAESPGESVTRVQFFRYGIPAPTLQYPVRRPDGRTVGVADFSWEDHRHLGEFDGKVKYLDLLRPGETPSDCVFREKQREDAMRADCWGMTRFVWSMVMPGQARRTMVDLRHALEESRRLYVRGRVVLAS